MYSWGWVTGHSLGEIWQMQCCAGVALSYINLLDMIIELFNFTKLAHSTVLPTHHEVTLIDIYLPLIFLHIFIVYRDCCRVLSYTDKYHCWRKKNPSQEDHRVFCKFSVLHLSFLFFKFFHQH